MIIEKHPCVLIRSLGNGNVVTGIRTVPKMNNNCVEAIEVLRHIVKSKLFRKVDPVRQLPKALQPFVELEPLEVHDQVFGLLLYPNPFLRLLQARAVVAIELVRSRQQLGKTKLTNAVQ